MAVGHYENFPVASLLLPAPLRRPVEIIYRFARSADDIADEGDDPADVRLRKLAEFRRQLDAPVDPLFRDVAKLIAQQGLPLQLFADLFDAFSQDVTKKRYENFSTVLDYCRRSANPVGRLVLRVAGHEDGTLDRASDAVCTALQLVNFWQDAALDWRKGRVYLPQEDLARFGVSERGIEASRCDDAWRALIAFETARTRALLESGRPLVRSLPWRFGLEISGVVAGGHRILDRIDAVEGDVFRRRPRLGRGDWPLVAWRAMMPPRTSGQAQ